MTLFLQDNKQFQCKMMLLDLISKNKENYLEIKCYFQGGKIDCNLPQRFERYFMERKREAKESKATNFAGIFDLRRHLFSGEMCERKQNISVEMITII